MKKILIGFLMICMMLALVCCKKKTETTTEATGASAVENTVADSKATKKEKSQEAGTSQEGDLVEEDGTTESKTGNFDELEVEEGMEIPVGEKEGSAGN